MSVNVMLARRPSSDEAAFGHIDVDGKSRQQLRDMLSEELDRALVKEEVPYHPDDLASSDEVLVAELGGIDDLFQADAPWSLERTALEIRSNSLPDTLDAGGIRTGLWSFYVIRAEIGDQDILAIRSRSPTWGLKDKLITRFLGTELKLINEPLVSFDSSFEVFVVDYKVYFLKPRQAERLFIDSELVKERAPSTVTSFRAGISANMSDSAETALLRVCQSNSNIARRVERLNRDTDLSAISTEQLREGLGDAGMLADTFGTSDHIEISTDSAAMALIDIAADLYYQPRFAERSRRVAAFRTVTSTQG